MSTQVVQPGVFASIWSFGPFQAIRYVAISLYRSYLPADIDSRELDESTKVRLIIGFVLALLFWGPFFSLLFILFGMPTTAAGLIFVTILTQVTPFLLNTHHSLKVAAHYLTATVLLGVTWVSCFAGGHESPALVWIVTLPIIPTMLVGRRPGLVWSFVSVAVLTVFYLCYHYNIPIPQYLTSSQKNALDILGVISVALYVFQVGLFYELIKNVTVNQLKEATEKQERAKALAEDTNHTKSQFLANVSHEIRTPMTGVIGMTELMLESKLSEEQNDYLQTIDVASRSLLGIINDILTFSKAEAGKIELAPVPVSIREFIQQLPALFHVAANEKEVNLVFHLDENVPEYVELDPLRLRQVLVNLVGNAIKFTDKGGAVVVIVRAENIHEGKARLCLSVSDTGIGIPEEKQARIFEAFAQADRSTARDYGGTGLGLSISVRLVSLMGGILKVQSRPNIGSVFHFTSNFRIAEAPSDKNVSNSSTTWSVPDSIPYLNILVAEDNKFIRILLKRRLEKWGFNPTIVKNGREAVSEAEKHNFDLILLDMHMPELSGYAAIKEIRDREEEHSLPRTPAIAVTADILQTDRDSCIAAGVDDYVVKPIDMDILFRKILKATSSQEIAA